MDMFFLNTDTFNRGIPGGRLCLKWEVSRFGSLFFYKSTFEAWPEELLQRQQALSARRFWRAGEGGKNWRQFYRAKVEDVGMP